MSLLQQIITADSQSGGWSSTFTKYIHEVNFRSREEAEKAFEQMLPFYKKIVTEGTWGGIENATGSGPSAADQVSFNHHMWVDENRNGFSFCVYFDSTIQRDQIKKDFRKFFKDNQVKLHVALLNEREETRIRHLKSATHSVELDVSNSITDYEIITDFMNVAMTMPENQQTLYGDTIGKDGFTRLKAYFGSQAAADNFAKIAESKIERPLNGLTQTLEREQNIDRLVKSPIIREFSPSKNGLILA